MKEENINFELINEIYREIKETKEIVKAHDKKFDKINIKLEEYDNSFKEIKEKFNSIDYKLESIEKKVDTTDKIERLHFEYTRNKFERLDQKIDTSFKYLDDKIENTKKKMISEITDLFEIFSVNTSRLIENIENKIETEMRERKTDISKLEGLNDYDKIVLENLESRISILEEESERYTIN